MAYDSYVQLAPDGAGKRMDTAERTVNSQVVQRQRVIIGGNLSDNFTEPTAEGAMPTVDQDNQSIISLLDRIANRLDLDPVTGRVRCSIDAGTLPTVTTVTTVSTVTSMTQLGGVSAASMPMDLMMNNWADNFLPCVSS
jgi:hypothetical protein